MNISRLISRVIIFGIIGIILNNITDWALAESKRDWIKAGRYHTPLQWKEYYSLPEDYIDILILGSSRSYYGIDPYVIKDQTGLNTFNLGSPRQPLPATYYILKEVFANHNPGIIILELNYELLTRFHTRLYKKYVFENMKPSPNKWLLFLNGFKLNEKIYYFLPMLKNTHPFEYIFNKITGKMKNPFDNDEVYKGLGFVCKNDTLIATSSVNDHYQWIEKDINPETIIYFKKIAELVHQNNAELIVVNFPYHNNAEIINQKEFTRNYRNFASFDDTIKILDFQNSKLTFLKHEFADNCHLNAAGAKKISLAIADSLNHIIKHNK